MTNRSTAGAAGTDPIDLIVPVVGSPLAVRAVRPPGPPAPPAGGHNWRAEGGWLTAAVGEGGQRTGDV